MVQPPKKELFEPVSERNLVLLCVLSILTLGLYGFYLIYVWAKDLNRLLGTSKYKPGVMLGLSIATCGIGALVIEYIYAKDLEQEIVRHQLPVVVPNLSMLVLALNAAAVILSIIPAAVVLAVPMGITASALIQYQLNSAVTEPQPSPSMASSSTWPS